MNPWSGPLSLSSQCNSTQLTNDFAEALFNLGRGFDREIEFARQGLQFGMPLSGHDERRREGMGRPLFKNAERRSGGLGIVQLPERVNQEDVKDIPCAARRGRSCTGVKFLGYRIPSSASP